MKERRAVIAVGAVLALLCCSTVTFAAPPRTVSTADAVWTAPVQRVGQWLGEVLDGLLTGPVSQWQRTGCSADPSGAQCPSNTEAGAPALDLAPACDAGSGDCLPVPLR